MRLPLLLAALALPVSFLSAQTTLRLLPAQAKIEGASLRVEMTGGLDNFGFWSNSADRASWTVELPSAGTWEILAEIAAPEGTPSLSAQLGTARTQAPVPRSTSWNDYRTVSLGRVTVDRPGSSTLTIAPAGSSPWSPVNLSAVLLRPAR